MTGTGVTVAIVDAYASPTLLADGNRYAANHSLKEADIRGELLRDHSDRHLRRLSVGTLASPTAGD